MKLQCVVQGMVLAAIVFVAARTIAEPVHLVCTETKDKSAVTRITFDELRGIAFFEDNPASAASFTATNIKWSGFYEKNLPTAFNLDRISGVLIVKYPYSDGKRYNCVVTTERKF